MSPFFQVILLFSGLLQAAELPRLTVTGRRPGRALPEEGSGSAGERRELEGSGPVTLPSLLRQSPSVTVRQTGGEGTAAEYWVRGQDPHQTRFFLEGVPLSDAAYDSAPVHWLPLAALGAADVYPDDVPVGLGGDGLGGAIRFVFPTERLASSVKLRSGAYGYGEVGGLVSLPEAQVFLGYQRSREDFPFRYDGGTQFEAADDTIVRRENNQFQRFTILPVVPLSKNLRVFGLGVRNEVGVPGPVGLASAATLKQSYALAALEWKASPWRSHLFTRFAQDGFHNPNYATVTASAPDSRSLGKAVGVGTTYFNGQELVRVGGTYEHLEVRTDNGPLAGTQGQGRLQAESGIARSFFVDDSNKLQPSLSLHYYEYLPGVGAAVRRQMVLASPRLSLTSELGEGWRLRGTAGSYFRAPTLFEIYGSPGGFTPNPELEAERAEKVQAGLDREWRRPVEGLRAIRASYSYSIAFARELIAYLQNSQFSRVATNIGNGRIDSHELGLELEFSGVPLLWRNAVNVLWTENRTAIPYQQGRELPERPNWRWQSDVGWTSEVYSAGYSFAWVGPTYSDLANLRRRSAAQDHSLWAGVRPRGYGSFRLEVRNLFDTLTVDSSFAGEAINEYTTGYTGYPAPGRRVYLSWQYDF